MAILKDDSVYHESYSTALSFPSAFDRGGNHLVIQGRHEVGGIGRTSYSKAKTDYVSSIFGKAALDRIQTKNIGGYENNSTLYSVLYDESNINLSEYRKSTTNTDLRTRFNAYSKDNERSIYFENPFHMPTAALREMNTYRFTWNKATKTIVHANKNNNNGSNVHYAQTKSAPSMFNPSYNIQVVGMSSNVPLLTDAPNATLPTANDIGGINDLSNCSISKLVELSNNGQLGVGIYRFADFMYCKDLGKVSNNYLITLRRFGLPVGDHIGFMNSPKYRKKSASELGYDAPTEVGHLVTWFGTDDNKLEDILKYSYSYSWKDLKSQIQELPSQEDNAERGVLGLISNFNPAYHNRMNSGQTGTHNIWAKLGSAMGFASVAHSVNTDAMRMYDHNKVYEPKQTIKDWTIPEGTLKFQHEFTLTFSYKLRAYENINPKTAFLDLIGNILDVTYFHGKFWGGAQRIIGPSPNNSSYRKANAFIDNAFSKMGGALEAFASGNFDTQQILGMLSSMAADGVQFIKDAAQEAASTITGQGVGGAAKAAAQGIVKKLQELDGKVNFSTAMKGQLKNMLGRPAFYAFDSLLKGDDTGLWHVTIGNPRNPIATFGNLILTNSSIQHSGPLGIDDFPTEIKVTCQLRHARSRDMTDIGRMYTQGISALHMTQQRNPSKDFREYIHAGDEKYDPDAIEKEGNRLGAEQQAARESQRKEDGTIPAKTEEQYAAEDKANTALNDRREALTDENLRKSTGYQAAAEIKTASLSGEQGVYPFIASAYNATWWHNGNDLLESVKTSYDEVAP